MPRSLKIVWRATASKWALLNSRLEQKNTALSAWASLVTIVGLPLLFAGGVTTYFQLRNELMQPEIALAFGTAKELRFWVLNQSSMLLREPQYSFGLWDLDARAVTPGEDPGNLQIPGKDLDYVRPMSAIGPWALSSLSATAATVPAGHVVFGWLSVQCPTCKARRHYWLLWRKGEGAWYVEIPFEDEPRIFPQLSRVLRAGRDYQKIVEEIAPQEKRIRITDTG